MYTKYGKIARDLRERIEDGTYPPGSKLPSIPELMDTYGVARDTVRDAVAALANEGLVTPRSGVGTVVRDLSTVDLNSSLTTPHPLWQDTAGLEAKILVISAGRESADQEIAERLNVTSGAEVVHRIKHYYKGRDVTLIHEQWITEKVAKAIKSKAKFDVSGKEVETTDLYSMMRLSGFSPAETTEVVTARMPDPTEKDVMGMPPGIPVLLTNRTTFDKSSAPLETSNFSGCADRTSQTYTVSIPD